MRFWTTVAVSDEFAASVLSTYFELNHPVLGLFDADLFLDDFINLRQDFCSAFLVNALLALNAFYYQADRIKFRVPFPLLSFDDTGGGGPSGEADLQRLEKPLFMPGTLANLSGLWRILQDVADAYFSRDTGLQPAHDTVPISFAESRYQDLLRWATACRDDLFLEEPEYVLILQVLFHCATLDIFAPFAKGSGAYRIRHFTSDDSSVDSVIRASILQLQRILVSCRVEKKKLLLMAHTNAAILHVSNAMLRMAGEGNVDKADCQAHFDLCIANCTEMYTCFPVFASVGRGLLAMAMRDRFLDGGRAKELIAALEARGQHHDGTARKTLGSFTIDFDLAMREPNNARAVVLAARFDELILLSELTTGTYES
ncbi:beta-calactosidase [Purpureocillium lavendulum]|uniref:Beta-calactosidase n=1 Tax=Purpureocillium lavendulum TaxID=1247861 RepID=A0AB34FMZ1_9HYPO|nr:beta-calactosidase [Purpureocillium lavendulum]